MSDTTPITFSGQIVISTVSGDSKYATRKIVQSDGPIRFSKDLKVIQCSANRCDI